MSLIRVRQRRKKTWIDTRKGLSPSRLVGLFIVVAVLIWYLSGF
ncbi:MAG: hypothetical protein OEZ65_05935 [Gemmatimonadota bacterium]|nr:hypothetical protein [Gemmatimonadota bacterium]